MSADDIWSLIADGLGVLSGFLLGWSALRINTLLREAWDLREMLTTSKSGVEKQTFESMRKKAQEQAGAWNTWDERRLYGGMFILFLSFACKLVSSLFKAHII
ncbi:MAG TPA: hypothetical protein VK642_06950 [Burkholderiales bacterium]|nr:hypothetical protein [Burkholderiales bacterium]